LIDIDVHKAAFNKSYILPLTLNHVAGAVNFLLKIESAPTCLNDKARCAYQRHYQYWQNGYIAKKAAHLNRQNNEEAYEKDVFPVKLLPIYMVDKVDKPAVGPIALPD